MSNHFDHSPCFWFQNLHENTVSNLGYLGQVILPSLPLASFQRELFDLCESFKTRYISIHVMNYYVCDNMASYENLLLRILFGFLLLSVLFCKDSHHGVLSKDFIYGCLVRNRKLDPSMGDNFKCLYLNVCSALQA